MKDLTPVSYDQLEPENGYVIGEIACGHEGDINRLKQLMDAVTESGAQIIKFQIFKTEERAIKGHKEWQIFDRLTLSSEEWKEGVIYARERGLGIFADVFGEESFLLAQELNVDGYKIHSEDLLNSYFVLQVASTEKIVLIGVGGAKRIEILSLLELLNKKDALYRVILMTGVQTFPTPLEAHSLDEVGDLIIKYSHYGVKIGFSDHIEGNKEEAHIVPLMALAKGACIIEKHVTVDRDDRWIDYHSALSKGDFKRFVANVRSIRSILKPIGHMNTYEKQYRHMFKKSAVAGSNMQPNQILEAKGIKFSKDVENTIPIASLNLVGRVVGVPIRAGELCRLAKFKNRVGGIIVARCTSSRMPNKALREIQGRESVALVIDRIKRCRNLDCVILATSTDGSDDILVEIAEREGILSFRGSLENVASRYYEAAKYFELDHFVRITGDAILCDEVMIDRAIESHLHECCDVTFMTNMPFGTHKEVVSMNAIRTIMETASIPANTEYLEYYLENDRYFNVNYVASDYVFDPKLRITLDYEEDLAFFERIFEHFNRFKPDFTLSDALEWLGENPDVIEINAHKTQKTPMNQDLDVSLNI